MKTLSLNVAETESLLRFDSVEVNRNGQWYIVEIDYCSGYRITAVCEYDAVKLARKTNKKEFMP